MAEGEEEIKQKRGEEEVDEQKCRRERLQKFFHLFFNKIFPGFCAKKRLREEEGGRLLYTTATSWTCWHFLKGREER